MVGAATSRTGQRSVSRSPPHQPDATSDSCNNADSGPMGSNCLGLFANFHPALRPKQFGSNTSRARESGRHPIRAFSVKAAWARSKKPRKIGFVQAGLQLVQGVRSRPRDRVDVFASTLASDLRIVETTGQQSILQQVARAFEHLRDQRVRDATGHRACEVRHAQVWQHTNLVQ